MKSETTASLFYQEHNSDKICFFYVFEINMNHFIWINFWGRQNAKHRSSNASLTHSHIYKKNDSLKLIEKWRLLAINYLSQTYQKNYFQLGQLRDVAEEFDD